MIHGNYANADTFVAFLSTGKGTYYAFTINDKDKFMKFFKTILYPEIPSNGSLAELQEYSSRSEKYNNLKEKYFTDRFTAPINKNNINNSQVLAAFLQFLNEAEMGVDMFKTNSNFDSFEKVTYDPNSPNKIKTQACNN